MTAAGPKISVMTPVLNDAGNIERCIESVAAQRYPLKEHIVIDGASSDGTVDILRTNAGRLAHWESDRDRGIFHALNKALAHASGDWLYCLGASDTLWEPTVLGRMATHLRGAGRDIRVIYGRVALTMPSGRVLELRGRDWRAYAHSPVASWGFHGQGIFMHRSLIEDHGGFDETFRITGDHELLLRELKSAEALFVPDVTVAAFEYGGLSTDPEQIPTIRRELRRALVKNGLPTKGTPRLRTDIRYAAYRLAKPLIGKRGANSVVLGLMALGRVERQLLGRSL